MSDRQEVEARMKEWARWHERSGSYGSPLGELISRGHMTSLPFGSRVPKGVNCPPWIMETDAALHRLMESTQRQPVLALRAWYLHGRDAAMKMLGIKVRRIYQLKERGEVVLMQTHHCEKVG